MEDKVNVYDDFLPTENFNEIVESLKDLEYRLIEGVTDTRYPTGKKHDFQFEHHFYELPFHNNPTIKKIGKLLDKLNPTVLYRAKLNLNPNTHEIIEHGYHNDYFDENEAKKFLSAVYYLNTNNGYTKFENGTIVESIANRLVTFNAGIKHTGSSCTDVSYRMVLNLMYIPVGEAN